MSSSAPEPLKNKRKPRSVNWGQFFLSVLLWTVFGFVMFTIGHRVGGNDKMDYIVEKVLEEKTVDKIRELLQ